MPVLLLLPFTQFKDRALRYILCALCIERWHKFLCTKLLNGISFFLFMFMYDATHCYSYFFASSWTWLGLPALWIKWFVCVIWNQKRPSCNDIFIIITNGSTSSQRKKPKVNNIMLSFFGVGRKWKREREKNTSHFFPNIRANGSHPRSSSNLCNDMCDA